MIMFQAKGFFVFIMVFMFALAGCESADRAGVEDKAYVESVVRDNPELVLEILRENKALLAQLVQEGARELEQSAWKEDILRQLDDPLEPAIDPERVILGNPEAEVTVVEYFNFLCPVCHVAGQTVKDVLKERPDQSRLILKHVARDEVSRKAAMYFEAVFRLDRDKAMEFKEMVFARSSGLVQDTSQTLEKIVSELGLDMEAVLGVLEDPKIQSILDRDLEEAEKLDILGTPVILVNGVMLHGFVSQEEMFRVMAMITGQDYQPEDDFRAGSELDLCFEDFEECE